MAEYVPLGTKVAPYGKVGAISVRDGERYYMLVDKSGVVSLIPAFEVERLFKESQDDHK